ncbi:MAG: FCD domain-containing protein [Thermodesulfobacteriota bacterium]
MAIGFEPLKTKRAFELIVELLKDKIFAGEYRSGDQLPTEREMAEQLQVSRPTVREAYRALELLNIVEIKRGKEGGAFILEPTYHSLSRVLSDLLRLQNVSLDDLTEARLLLEKDILRLAVSMVTDHDLSEIETWITRGVMRLDQGELATQENINFHLRLAEAAGNPILCLALASVMDLLAIFLRALPVNLEISRQVTREHYEILSALKVRDESRLGEVMEKHIRAINVRLSRLGRVGPSARRGGGTR